MEKGILLLALNDELYVKYAINLAISIKFNSPNSNITLIHSNNLSKFSKAHIDLFDNLIECPKEYYKFKNGNSYIKPKLYLDLLTPYEETLFIDVDTIYSPYKKVENIFDQCKGKSFVMVCRGLNTKSSDWVNVDEIKEFYKIKNWFDCSSEIIYFKKSTTVFEEAREINKDFELNYVYYRSFANAVPDEPPLIIAMLKKHKKPLIIPFNPTYWEGFDKNFKNNLHIFNNFELLSIGGNKASNKVQSAYNNLIKWYQQKTGITTFNYESKLKLKERKLI